MVKVSTPKRTREWGFRDYGDNREPGKLLTDAKKKGNLILETAFALLNEGQHLEDIPPFFVFKKTGGKRCSVLRELMKRGGLV